MRRPGLPRRLLARATRRRAAAAAVLPAAARPRPRGRRSAPSSSSMTSGMPSSIASCRWCTPTCAAAGVDDPDLPRLKGLHRRTWYENQLALHRVRPALDELARRGHPRPLPEGRAAGARALPRPRAPADGRRRHPGALGRCASAPSTCSSTTGGATSADAPTPQLFRRYHGSGLHHPDGGELDLHWHLGTPLLLPDDERGVDDDFWDAAVPFVAPAHGIDGGHALPHRHAPARDRPRPVGRLGVHGPMGGRRPRASSAPVRRSTGPGSSTRPPGDGSRRWSATPCGTSRPRSTRRSRRRSSTTLRTSADDPSRAAAAARPRRPASTAPPCSAACPTSAPTGPTPGSSGRPFEPPGAARPSSPTSGASTARRELPAAAAQRARPATPRSLRRRASRPAPAPSARRRSASSCPPTSAPTTSRACLDALDAAVGAAVGGHRRARTRRRRRRPR